MKAKKLPSWEYLNECFRYDSETGELYWRVRQLEHFKDELICKRWNNKNSGKVSGCLSKGYLTTRIDSNQYMNHRIIWKLITKKDPPDLIDHIDGNPLNNKFINLRKATNSENCRNTKIPKTNSTGFKGVSYNKGSNKYQAHIRCDNKKYHLGYFNTPEEASLAYQEAAKKFHQDFAKF